MIDIQLNCMMIAQEIPLEQVAFHLGSTFAKRWNEVLVIEGEQLETILKFHARPYQSVLLYSYGAATFINCAVDEMRTLLDFVDSITNEVDNKDVIRSADVHRIWFLDEEDLQETLDPNSYHLNLTQKRCKLFRSDEATYPITSDVFMLASHIIAQSVATEQIEKEIQVLLDNSEEIVQRMQRSQYALNNKKRGKLTSEVVRFQYDLIKSAQVFGAPTFANNNMEIRDMYRKLSEYYELDDRFDVVHHKIQELKNINERYSETIHHRAEHRLLMLEVFLLALFPFKYMIAPLIRDAFSWAMSFL